MALRTPFAGTEAEVSRDRTRNGYIYADQTGFETPSLRILRDLVMGSNDFKSN